METPSGKSTDQRLANAEALLEELRKQLNQTTIYLNSAMQALGMVFIANENKAVTGVQLNFNAPKESHGILTKMAEMVTSHDRQLQDKRIITRNEASPLILSAN